MFHKMSANPDKNAKRLHFINTSINCIKYFVTANRFKLNKTKTELMLVKSKETKYLRKMHAMFITDQAQVS